MRQKRLEAQLSAFLVQNGVKAKEKDVSRAIYRLRTMLSHLNRAKRDRNFPPPEFDNLRYLVDKCQLGGPAETEESDDDDDEENDLMIVETLGKFIPTVDISSEDECGITSPVVSTDEIDIDNLIKRLFTPEKKSKRKPKELTPQKVPPNGLVNDKELEALMDQTLPAPRPNQYRMMFKRPAINKADIMKRPANATETASDTVVPNAASSTAEENVTQRRPEDEAINIFPT